MWMKTAVLAWERLPFVVCGEMSCTSYGMAGW